MTSWTQADEIASKSLRVAIYSLVAGGFALIATIIGVAVAFFTPEIRKEIGLDAQAPIIEVKCLSSQTSCAETTFSNSANKKISLQNVESKSPADNQETSSNKSIRYAAVDTRNDSGLEIREIRNISSASIGFVPEGEQVEVIYCEDKNAVVNARLGNWCRISYQGKEGWGFGPYIGIKIETIQSNDSDESDQIYEYIVDTRDDSGLNLRADKSLESDSVEFAQEGGEVKMIYCEEEVNFVNGREGSWCRVEYNNAQGWAWGWFLKKREKS